MIFQLKKGYFIGTIKRPEVKQIWHYSFINFHYVQKQVLTKPFHQCSLCLHNIRYMALFACNTVDYILSLTVFLIKQTTFTEKTMKIILDLNNYVKQTCEKVLQPLLLQNDCKDIKINTSSWVFEKCLHNQIRKNGKN